MLRTNLLKKNLPTIISIVSCIGVVITAIVASKNTVKAEAKESTPEKAMCYIPTVAVASVTIIGIISSDHISRKRWASLAAMCALAEHKLIQYQNKVKEHCGEETHKQIMDEITKEECNPEKIWSAGFLSPISLNPGELSDPEAVRTFFDHYSQRCFESTMASVLEAEYHLNRNYVLGGEIGVNEFYRFLGISELPEVDNRYWSYEGGMYWIDFNHRLEKLDDGMEVIAIEMVMQPDISPDELESETWM